MYTFTLKLVYWQLLLYGVHVGHSFLNSIIFSAWLVYTFSQNILIINLFKTMLLLKNGYIGLNGAVQFSGSIWFINLHRSVELFVNYAAKQCGEFSYTTYWIHGMVSNWLTFGNTFRKLNRMVTGSHKGQFAKLEFDSNPWIMSRLTWPRAIFVSSVFTSPHPTKEAFYAYIPCLGIVDTDISGHIANIPIPGNDDSLDCIVFYNTHISQYILEKKYSKVFGWFLNIRCSNRFLRFKDWLSRFYITNNGNIDLQKLQKKKRERESLDVKYKKIINFEKNFLSDNWIFGLDFFFAKTFFLKSFKEQVDLYEPEEKDLNFDIFFLYNKDFIFLKKIINFYYIKNAWTLKRFIKKLRFNDKFFKLNFMVGYYFKFEDFKDWETSENYFLKRFLVNRIFKSHLKYSRMRFNKYISTFVKYFYTKKYLTHRSFLNKYTTNLLTVSYLSYVSLSYGSYLFNNNIYKPLLSYTNFYSNILKNKKKNFLYKWSFFKKSIKSHISKLLTDNNINKYLKFFLFYKTFKTLKVLFIKSIKSIFIFYNFIFSFFYWNRFYNNKYSFRNKNYFFLRLNILNKIKKKYFSFNLLYKSLQSFSNFKYLYLKKNLKVKSLLNIKSFSFLRFFKLNYLNNKFNINNNYFLNNLKKLKKNIFFNRRLSKRNMIGNLKFIKKSIQFRSFYIFKYKLDSLDWFYNKIILKKFFNNIKFNFNLKNIYIYKNTKNINFSSKINIFNIIKFDSNLKSIFKFINVKINKSLNYGNSLNIVFQKQVPIYFLNIFYNNVFNFEFFIQNSYITFFTMILNKNKLKNKFKNFYKYFFNFNKKLKKNKIFNILLKNNKSKRNKISNIQNIWNFISLICQFYKNIKFSRNKKLEIILLDFTFLKLFFFFFEILDYFLIKLLKYRLFILYNTKMHKLDTFNLKEMILKKKIGSWSLRKFINFFKKKKLISNKQFNFYSLKSIINKFSKVHYGSNKLRYLLKFKYDNCYNLNFNKVSRNFYYNYKISNKNNNIYNFQNKYYSIKNLYFDYYFNNNNQNINLYTINFYNTNFYYSDNFKKSLNYNYNKIFYIFDFLKSFNKLKDFNLYNKDYFFFKLKQIIYQLSQNNKLLNSFKKKKLNSKFLIGNFFFNKIVLNNIYLLYVKKQFFYPSFFFVYLNYYKYKKNYFKIIPFNLFNEKFFFFTIDFKNNKFFRYYYFLFRFCFFFNKYFRLNYKNNDLRYFVRFKKYNYYWG